LAGKLLKIRQRLGWTQATLAEHLGVDSGAVSRYERGLREPSLLEVLEYARIGEVTMEVLVDDRRKLSR
jgi:transcriptional regulator with XRE-family HTH domain